MFTVDKRVIVMIGKLNQLLLILFLCVAF